MDEQRLIARILDGHESDYGYFLERYGGEVFAIVSRLVPNPFIGRSSFSTWVCRIAYTTTVSWLRKKRIKYLSIEEKQGLSDKEVDEVLDDESRLNELRGAIALLRPDEQMLLELYYFESRPMADIAYILDVEPGTIATRLHRIRRKLYSMISRK